MHVPWSLLHSFFPEGDIIFWSTSVSVCNHGLISTPPLVGREKPTARFPSGDGKDSFEATCPYRRWRKPRRHRLRSAAPVPWCRRRAPWIPQPCPWMSADASWTCFARETGLESNTQGSLSTGRSQSTAPDSGSFPVIIVSTFRSMHSVNLLINTNTAPRCLFGESILHMLVITLKPLVVRKRRCWYTHIPVSTERRTSAQYLEGFIMGNAGSDGL